eukprot:3563668-Rhodomonas_salina.6
MSGTDLRVCCYQPPPPVTVTIRGPKGTAPVPPSIMRKFQANSAMSLRAQYNMSGTDVRVWCYGLAGGQRP